MLKKKPENQGEIPSCNKALFQLAPSTVKVVIYVSGKFTLVKIADNTPAHI